MRSTLVLAVVALLVSACVDRPNDASTPLGSSSMAPPASFDEDTGAIEGLVVDTELRPLLGAHVLLRETQAQATTDAEGRFTFSHLQPGRYSLFVAYVGAAAGAKSLDVAAGAVTTVQFALEVLSLAEPRMVTLQERGVAGCFLSVRVNGGANSNVYCGHAQSEVDRNRHLIYWPAIQPMTGWSGTVFEMSWRSTQAAGQGMQGKIYIAYEGKGCGGFELVFLEGASPLRGVANASRTSQFLETASKQCPAVCNPDSCSLMSWVGGVPHVLGPSSAHDVGLLFEQSFVHYHTAFFGQDVPQAYSALADA